MITINITISGSQETIKKLEKFDIELNDWYDTFDDIGTYLMDVYGRLAFDTEGGILGERWQDLSPAYELRKAAIYPGRGILEASGVMRKSYEKIVSKTDLEIKNKDPKAVYHQSTEARTVIPRRPLIGMTNDIEARVIRYFVDGVSGKIRKVFA